MKVGAPVIDKSAIVENSPTTVIANIRAAG
jgi:hypothetical protein